MDDPQPVRRPQPGLFVEQTAQHLHVEWVVRHGVPAEAVRAAVAQARHASVSLRGPNVVWGFDPDLWEELLPHDRPANLHRFAGVSGPWGTAPATQRSIWLWVAGDAWERIWATAGAVDGALADVADRVFEQQAYTPFDDRDPIGFIDGTENPALDEATEVALYPSGPGAGGTAVLVQRWVHELAAFRALSLPEQEAVMGRTRSDSTELAGDAQPPTSHVSRNVIEDAAGVELHIFRRNTPFAGLAETGTMFVGCTRDPARIDVMLDRMFGVTDDGLTDHLTRFSHAVTGSYYFAPALDALTEAFGALDGP